MYGSRLTRFPKRLIAIPVLILFLLSPVTSWACSSLIVGKNASATGAPLFSRTEDNRPYYAKRFFVFPAGYYKKGQTLLDRAYNYTHTFTHDSYRMTATPDMPVNGPYLYDQAGVNEFGLAISGTNTTSLSAAARQHDPLVEDGGFSESLLNTVLLAECKTVDEAIAFAGNIIATVGAAEGCLFMLADQDQVWIMENVSGHRWVAARVPDDSFVVVANDHVIDYVDLSDTRNFRGSPDLEQFAIDNGFAVYGTGANANRVNIAASYGRINADGNRFRRWRGYNLFAPSRGIALKESDDIMPYATFVRPDAPISATDIMNFQRDRFQGTPYDLSTSPQSFDQTGRETEPSWPRPIGHFTQKETHVYEMVQGLPPEIGARWWFLEAQSEHSVNLPFYGNITDTHPNYRKNVLTRSYDPESAFWIFQDIAVMARSNRAMYGMPIKDYWRQYELKLYDEQPAVEKELLSLYARDREAAAKWITDYTMATAQAAMNRAAVIRKALKKHIETAPGTPFVVPPDSVVYADAFLNTATSDDIESMAAAMHIAPAKITPATVASFAESELSSGAPELPAGYTLLPVPGVTFEAALSSGNAARVRYTLELRDEAYAVFGNSVENVKNGFALRKVLSGYPEGVELVGPNGLVSLPEAIRAGVARVIGDGSRATVTVDFYVYDDAGDPVYSGGMIVVPDGLTDGRFADPLWAAAAGGREHSSDSSGGCNAGFPGLAVLALIALAFRRSRR